MMKVLKYFGAFFIAMVVGGAAIINMQKHVDVEPLRGILAMAITLAVATPLVLYQLRLMNSR